MNTPKPHHEFFKVSRLVPEDQNLATVDTQTKVRDALTLMAGSGFDQVPVTHGSRVVGVFSHRSLCAGLNAVRRTDDPQDHLVVDFLEDLSFVRTGTDFGDVLRAMEKTDVALLGDEENLLAVITSGDIARFLWNASRPFILLQDVELALRALMRRACPDQAVLAQCIAAVMPGRDTNKAKDRLEDLTLYEQIQVATHPESYGKIFTKTLGGSRQIACSVLGQLSEIRNKVFHFRDELTLEELDSVLAARVWLHRKMAIAS